MERHGSIIRLRPQMSELYKQMHQAMDPELLKIIRSYHLQNYSIYYKSGWLFSYYEYIGESFAGDMRRMAQEPMVKDFWTRSGPCQEPLEDRKPGEWWAEMEEVFRLD